MLRVVIDASVALSWVFEDESDSRAEAIVDDIDEHVLIAPRLWVLEVTNALAVAERRRRISELKARALLTALLSLPVRVEPERQRPSYSRSRAAAAFPSTTRPTSISR